MASEFFGFDERVDEVRSERDSDREADDGLRHRAPSQFVAEGRVEAERAKAAEAQSEVDNVEHVTHRHCWDRAQNECWRINFRLGKAPTGIRAI